MSQSEAAYRDLESGSINGSSRSGTSRKTTILAVLLVIFIGATALFGAWVYRLKNDDSGSSESGDSSEQALKDFAAQIDSTRDTSVNPCDDFYTYACGQWAKTHTIPADKSRYSRTFDEMGEKITSTLLQINKEDWPILGTFYRACLDNNTIEEASLKPIEEYLASVEGITSGEEFLFQSAKAFAELGVESVVSIRPFIDAKDPTVNLLNLGQAGLTLGNPVLYTRDELIAKYEAHVANMFTLARVVEYPKEHARNVIALEKEIAKVTVSKDALRDPAATYNPIACQELATKAPWTQFFKALELEEWATTSGCNIEVKTFTAGIEEIVQKPDNLPLLKSWLRWKLIHTFAPHGPKAFVEEDFDFFGKILSGQEAQGSRENWCTDNSEAYLGELIGHYFVTRQFPGESKAVVKEMIQFILQAFEDNLPAVSWMDDETRARAVEKVHQVVDLIGYPNQWTDYSSVSLSGAHYQNIRSLLGFKWSIVHKILKNPVDKTIWQMPPSMVNAYYEPSLNTINFPAGILQPYFFNVSYPSAMNFGGIGMVMGHELTHGFDDQGRQYDGTGKLTDWWTKASVDAFVERSKCYVDQYSAFTIREMHINGNLTLGENIADNGGIQTAFRAWKKWAAKRPAEKLPPTNPAMTAEQLFFLGYAQGWCTLTRPEEEERRIRDDEHSPPFARVLGPLQNFPEFAKAFNCKAGSKMVRPDKERCELW